MVCIYLLALRIVNIYCVYISENSTNRMKLVEEKIWMYFIIIYLKINILSTF